MLHRETTALGDETQYSTEGYPTGPAIRSNTNLVFNKQSLNVHRSVSITDSETKGYLQASVLKQLPHTLSLKGKNINTGIDGEPNRMHCVADIRAQFLELRRKVIPAVVTLAMAISLSVPVLTLDFPREVVYNRLGF